MVTSSVIFAVLTLVFSSFFTGYCSFIVSDEDNSEVARFFYTFLSVVLAVIVIGSVVFLYSRNPEAVGYAGGLALVMAFVGACVSHDRP